MIIQLPINTFLIGSQITLTNFKFFFLSVFFQEILFIRLRIYIYKLSQFNQYQCQIVIDQCIKNKQLKLSTSRPSLLTSCQSDFFDFFSKYDPTNKENLFKLIVKSTKKILFAFLTTTIERTVSQFFLTPHDFTFFSLEFTNLPV